MVPSWAQSVEAVFAEGSHLAAGRDGLPVLASILRALAIDPTMHASLWALVLRLMQPGPGRSDAPGVALTALCILSGALAVSPSESSRALPGAVDLRGDVRLWELIQGGLVASSAILRKRAIALVRIFAAAPISASSPLLSAGYLRDMQSDPRARAVSMGEGLARMHISPRFRRKMIPAPSCADGMAALSPGRRGNRGIAAAHCQSGCGPHPRSAGAHRGPAVQLDRMSAPVCRGGWHSLLLGLQARQREVGGGGR